MIEWLFNLIMAPIEWAVSTAIVFAVTAPYEQVYAVMGVAGVLLIALLYSMVPKREKTVQEAKIVPYEATEQDEIEARKILASV